MTTITKGEAVLHVPQRLAHETQGEYQARRRESQREVRKVIGAGLSGGINSREQQRNTMRRNGVFGKRVRAADALSAAFAAKRVTKAALRDEHGAVTLVGSRYTIEGGTPSKQEFVFSAGVGDGEGFYTARRIWLAGISAQRGY